MFDELIRELKRLDGLQRIPVSISTDAEGYWDRECPSAECLSQFKVHEDDWRDKVPDEKVFCPSCGHTADSQKWFTQDQAKHIREAAIVEVDQRISGAMRRDAQRWNARQTKNSFLSITLKAEARPRTILMPAAVAEPMRIKITCPTCSCRYAVLGAGFFCPACGHNAADLMFGQSVAAVRNALDALALLREAIPDRDTAETTKNLLVENGLQNAVTTFQRYR